MVAKMKYKKLTTALAISLIAVVAVFAYSTMTASAASAVVQDEKGDVKSATESANNVNAGTPDDVARGYLDITSVKAMKKNGKDQYVFSMTVAKPVPDDFAGEVCYGLEGAPGATSTIVVNPEDPDLCFFAWNWNVNDTGMIAGPNPIAPTVRWKDGKFEGIAFLDAGRSPVLDLDFSVNGTKITVTLDATLIEDNVSVFDGFFFLGASRNHRIDFGVGGDLFVGVADFTAFGNWNE